MKKFIFCLILICLSLPAQSYIPKFWTISSMLSRTRTSSPLKVVQDITVTDDELGNKYSVRETIYVKNGDLIKIKIQGKDALSSQVRHSLVYKANKKFYNNDGVISSTSVSRNFYSPLLYTKTATGLRKYLNLHGYIPPEGLSQPQTTFISNSVSSIPESYVHLSRTNGKVSFAITKKLSTPGSVHPTTWVNQDGFHLGKIRIDKNSVINLINYKEFTKKNWHPRKQIIKWKHHTFEINTISVTPISSRQVNSELSTNSLKNDGQLVNFNNEALESFYKIFR